MKLAKRLLIAISLGMVAATGTVNAQGFVTESTYPNFFAEMRPMVAKLSAADKKKAMDMEAAIMKMEGDHRMNMTKSTMEHRMAILKMRREYEDFTFSRGGQ
jgi:hypothetical protein